MDPAELQALLRELKARDTYLLDRANQGIALRYIWEDLPEEVEALRELWGPHCPEEVHGVLVWRMSESIPTMLALPLSPAEFDKWDAAAEAMEAMLNPEGDQASTE